MFEVAPDIHGVDLEMFDTEVLAAYVIDAPEPVLIETGYANGVKTLCRGLRKAGIRPSQLSHAVVSHIHLDHSGGAAALASMADGLDVYVHETTADHLLAPGKLVESSRRAMGTHFSEFGEPDPLDEDALTRVPDTGLTIDTGDRTLELLHTPGHAPDHLSVWDSTSRTLFVNEAIGSYYPRAGVWLPPATLPRFDVAAVEDTLDKLRNVPADRLALSHFGVRTDPSVEFDMVESRLSFFKSRIPALYEQCTDLEATEQAVREELLEMDEYDDAIVEFEARFQTHGFLRHFGLL